MITALWADGEWTKMETYGPNIKPLNYEQIKKIYVWVLYYGDKISIENGEPYLITKFKNKYWVKENGDTFFVVK